MIDGGGQSARHPAGNTGSLTSRRVSAASDDSFDASSYVHVDKKLNCNMPKCLLSSDISEKPIENRFAKPARPSFDSSLTKSGKRVLRKRMSLSEFNASRLKANLNNNSNASTRKGEKNCKDRANSSSSDNDTLPKSKKRSTEVLSAKIQRVLYEMKRLRQLDRDILRQFLIINDTIEEQKWMVEENKEAIRRGLSDEGEGVVNFDVVHEVDEDRATDEESVQFANIFSENPACKTVTITRTANKTTGKDSDLVSTSSDSALSMSGTSSTLSSTTSLPVSNRSTSPSTSNLSTTSSSYADTTEVKSNEIISTARREPVRREHDLAGDEIEGYYRMNGHAIMRGSYPYQIQSQSFGVSYDSRTQAYDDNTLDSAYSTTRGSTDSDSRDLTEYAIPTSRSMGNYNFEEDRIRHPVTSEFAGERQVSKSRPKRISVRPDGAFVQPQAIVGVRRASSVNERTSAGHRFLQNSSAQRHLARSNIKKRAVNLSFIPIAEQEPDLMLENGRLFSDPDSPAGQRSPRKSHLKSSRSFHAVTHSHVASHRNAPPMMSSISRSSTGSHLKRSQTTVNERCLPPDKPKEPIWVQRVPGGPVKPSIHYEIAQHYRHFMAQPYHHSLCQYGDNFYDARRASTSRLPPRHAMSDDRYPPTVTSPKTARGTEHAVYNWIQTQDDITYL